MCKYLRWDMQVPFRHFSPSRAISTIKVIGRHVFSDAPPLNMLMQSLFSAHDQTISILLPLGLFLSNFIINYIKVLSFYFNIITCISKQKT